MQKKHKGPLQLNLFEPRDINFYYKVIVTYKTEKRRATVLFHNGRGSREAMFDDAKGDCDLNFVLTRQLAGK